MRAHVGMCENAHVGMCEKILISLGWRSIGPGRRRWAGSFLEDCNFIAMKKLITVVMAMVMLSIAAVAQNANMMSMARAELSKRGLEESEVRTRLLENGIDVDNIQPADYPAYQSRVISILDQMQAEKNGTTGKGATVVIKTGSGSTSTEGNASPAAAATSADETPQTTAGEAAAEAALQTALAAEGVSPTEGSDIYGHSLFTGKSLDVFRTTDGAQAPETYVLGEGDEVHISIFGSSQTEIHQRIEADVSIQPVGATKIFLKGMTLAQARKAIQNRLSQHFSFRPDQIAVTITTARTVSVSIYGEVGVQGGFTISALNTAFNALAAAGGPTAIGSVRNIQLSRAGKTYTLDIYQYMKNPTIGIGYDIQNNDVLFVPVAQKVVSIEGAVNRPMRYEVIDKETLKDLIDYAGGLTWNAYPNFVQIERHEAGEVSYLEFDLCEVTSGKRKVNLAAGDIVRINLDTDGDQFLQPGDQLNVYDNTTYTNVGEVRVSGAVKTPMGTTYDESLTVHDLLSMAGGFAVGAAYDRVQVFRVNISDSKAAELECIQIKVDENYNPVGGEFQLQPYDHIVVRMTPDFTTGRSIELNGRVKYPGTYVLSDSKTQLWEIIEMAGGLLDDADPYASLFRTYNNRGNIGLDLRKVKSQKGKISNDPILMDGDVINIVRQENTVIIRETGTRMGQYVPAEYSAAQKIVLYQGPHSAAWYIRHYAGGFVKVANKNSVTVTMPNNQTEATKRFLGIRSYPTVEPGGVITVSIDQEKQEKIDTPKEKIDWGAEMRSTLSTLTSVVSLYLLLDRLNIGK